MKIEITEIEYPNVVNGQTLSRYDLFLDNVWIVSNVFQVKQEPFKVYVYFIKELIREWKTKYKRKYNTEFGENQKIGIEVFKPSTIILKEIQDIDLSFKQALEQIKLNKIKGDF